MHFTLWSTSQGTHKLHFKAIICLFMAFMHNNYNLYLSSFRTCFWIKSGGVWRVRPRVFKCCSPYSQKFMGGFKKHGLSAFFPLSSSLEIACKLMTNHYGLYTAAGGKNTRYNTHTHAGRKKNSCKYSPAGSELKAFQDEHIALLFVPRLIHYWKGFRGKHGWQHPLHLPFK